MDYKLTGLAKKVIILNIVLSVVIGHFIFIISVEYLSPINSYHNI